MILDDLSPFWEQLIGLHFYTKDLILRAEELDFSNATFLQTYQEQKHIIDHIVRAKSAEYSKKDVPDDSVDRYVNKNMSKAVGHAYRAFFDTADWLSIILRERIKERLGPYGRHDIVTVIPSYYSETRPRIDKLSEDIARIRAEKDVTIDSTILASVANYHKEILWLLEATKEFTKNISSLEIFLQRKNNVEKVIKRTEEMLAPYSRDSILAVIPDYYTTIKPRLDNIPAIIEKNAMRDSEIEVSWLDEQTHAISGKINSLEVFLQRKNNVEKDIKRIDDMLHPYDHECILAAIPFS